MNEDYLDLCKVLYVLKSNQVQATFYIYLILGWILEPTLESASYNGSRLSLIILFIPHRLPPLLDKMGITHFYSSRSCSRLKLSRPIRAILDEGRAFTVTPSYFPSEIQSVPIGCPCSLGDLS